MDKIGDYIHLHAENYRNYGIHMKTSNKKDKINGGIIENSSVKNDVEVIYNQVSNELKARIDALNTFPNKKEFEDKLNFFMKKNSNKKNKNDGKMEKAIIKMMEEDFDKSLGSIDLYNRDVSSEYLHRAKDNVEKIYRDAIESKRVYLSTIYRRMKSIEQIISTIQKEEKRKDLEEKLKKAYKIVGELTGQRINEIKKQVKSGENIKYNSLKEVSSYTTKLDGEEVNLVQYINELLNDDAISVMNIAKQKGNLFEYVIAAVAAQADVKANDSIKDIMKKMKKYHKGSNTNNVTINFEENFADTLNFEKINKTIGKYSSDGKIYQSIIASQGKVDVEFGWEDKQQKVSAKNYNLFSLSEMKIVEGQSLLYLLQDENHRFVNHYLNAAAEHIDSDIHQEYQNVINLMEKIILFKTFTGKTYGRDSMSADIFIVNNNKTGEAKIYDMKELLKVAESNINTYAKITGNGKPFSSLNFKNKKAISGYPERITDLLMDVHAVKISSYLKKGLLTQTNKAIT